MGEFGGVWVALRLFTRGVSAKTNIFLLWKFVWKRV
jgi:hypothetical protein